jgi:hypothetical protein
MALDPDRTLFRMTISSCLSPTLRQFAVPVSARIWPIFQMALQLLVLQLMILYVWTGLALFIFSNV